MDREKIYHFIGIKGTGMSALARVLNAQGYQVQGSDVTEHFFTDKGLEEDGITVLPFDPNNIKEGMEIIRGNAFKDDHPEVVRAHELGLKMTRYHNFLGKLIQNYTSIGITGSHGKTSTTGLLAHTLGLNYPTSFVVGDGSGGGVPDAKYFVLEADEYRRHFLAYEPDYAIFTNVDFDHPDYYKNIEDVYEADKQFAKQVKKKIIAYGDDPLLQRFSEMKNIYYYGTSDKDDIVAKNIERTSDGSRFDVYIRDEFYGHFFIPLFGEHSVLNSLAVIGVCYFEGLEASKIAEGLASFSGVKRRFNEQDYRDMVIVDDYAHHPSEIKATIDAARQKYPEKEIVAIFQPHTYSRTKTLLKDFAQALDQADEAYLCEIFASARESDHHDVSSQDIVNLMTKPSHFLPLEDVSALKNYHDAVFLFMGAGDVMKYFEAYKKLVEA